MLTVVLHWSLGTEFPVGVCKSSVTKYQNAHGSYWDLEISELSGDIVHVPYVGGKGRRRSINE